MNQEQKKLQIPARACVMVLRPGPRPATIHVHMTLPSGEIVRISASQTRPSPSATSRKKCVNAASIPSAEQTSNIVMYLNHTRVATIVYQLNFLVAHSSAILTMIAPMDTVVALMIAAFLVRKRLKELGILTEQHR